MHIYSITGEAEEALGAATEETLLMLKGAATRKGRLIEFGLSFDGVASTAAPVQVFVKRGNSTADGTNSAATEEKWDSDNPTAALTAFHSFSAEPTWVGQPLIHMNVHPQGGMFVWQAQASERAITLDDSTLSFIGITANAPAAVNWAGYLVWEE